MINIKQTTMTRCKSKKSLNSLNAADDDSSDPKKSLQRRIQAKQLELVKMN